MGKAVEVVKEYPSNVSTAPTYRIKKINWRKK